MCKESLKKKKLSRWTSEIPPIGSKSYIWDDHNLYCIHADEVEIDPYGRLIIKDYSKNIEYIFRVISKL